MPFALFPDGDSCESVQSVQVVHMLRVMLLFLPGPCCAWLEIVSCLAHNQNGVSIGPFATQP